MNAPIITLETYQYTPLRPGDLTFRLLKLLKYQGPELECELFPQPLSNGDHVPYEALSYVWGSNELVECIKLNEKRLWITDNLYCALQYLRLQDRDRYLWIDAICINQDDKEEQSWQVQQMGKIYGLAEGVLFWLGKATREIMCLMDSLNQDPRATPDSLREQLKLDDHGLRHYRTGLRQVLGRQWFTRVWILQEVANARKGTVYCGTRSVPAEIFARAPSVVGEVPQPHCQAILEIMPGPSRARSWWGQKQKRNLYTLLLSFQTSKATDERDKIYALLGMSSDPLDAQRIPIDYTKPVHKVVHRAVAYLLQTTRLSVHETLNLMLHFKTLETTCFVLPLEQGEATEILFPHLQSGRPLSVPFLPREPNSMSQGIPVVDDPALLRFETKLERSSKKDETYYGQVVRLALGGWTNESQEHDNYNKGLKVISWGSPENGVKMVVIQDRVRAIVQAAMQECAHIVKHLLRLKVRGGEGVKLEEEALLEAMNENHVSAIRTILRQTTHTHSKYGMYCDALQVASFRGHEQITRLLLDAGADVNAHGGPYGSALWAASTGGHEQIVKLLLDKGADVNMQPRGERFLTALVAASRHGHEQVVKLLLSRGADVNAQIHGRTYANALLAASFNGREQIVRLLLDAGANVHAQVGEYDSALQAAARGGNEHVVKLLLNAGANVNAQGGERGNALQAASFQKGSEPVVRLLLDAGADINARGGRYGSALQAASCGVVKQTVRLLLDAGADVNAQGGEYGNALQAASYQDYSEPVVRLLLDAGANVHAQGGPYGSALQAAIDRDNKPVVKLLRERGADINVEQAKD